MVNAASEIFLMLKISQALWRLLKAYDIFPAISQLFAGDVTSVHVCNMARNGILFFSEIHI